MPTRERYGATPASLARATVTAPAPPDSPEPADHDVPEPPRPSDPKQDWVDYAAGQGLPRDKAEAMSKADLMSRFGGRL